MPACAFALCLIAQQPGPEALGELVPAPGAWLVLGLFRNDRDNPAFETDLVGEAELVGRLDERLDGRAWRYFDDRLFSRNYDDYQDLRSYFAVLCDEPVDGVVAYAQTWCWAPAAVDASLRLGADSAVKAWLNGVEVARHEQGLPARDSLRVAVRLAAGWNRLLLKVANRADGRFGFYCRLTDPNGGAIDGLLWSPGGGDGPLAVATRQMTEAGQHRLPTAWRDWPYVAADAAPVLAANPTHRLAPHLWRPDTLLRASPFSLCAQGGRPPYRWSAEGELPAGLTLRPDGTIEGVVAAEPGNFPFTAVVTDSAGATARAELAIRVEERPNRWYEAARLVALIHGPERLREEELPAFAATMAAQGYGCGMVISWNNGEYQYRWPSPLAPDQPDVIMPYKEALEDAGIAFGMYLGNMDGPNMEHPDNAVRVIDDVMRRYEPRALWFDWAGWTSDSLDAIFSTVRTHDPNTVIVLNGVVTLSNGDWDVICLEGWGAWGARHWAMLPFELPWPKRHTMETWRLIADPAFSYSEGVQPDWREYARLMLTIIGEGYVCNLDSSPTIAGAVEQGRLTALDDSTVWQAHQELAAWANPPGLPPLHQAWTQVDPGPLAPAAWGYNVINTARDTIYCYLLENPYGKVGAGGGELVVAPLGAAVRRASCLNSGAELEFAQEGETLTVRGELAADEVATILKLELAGPLPPFEVARQQAETRPPGNLAFGKPSRLLSVDGTRDLVPSGFAFARYGNDGLLFTAAQGAYEWAWMYEVDLERVHRLDRLVVHFGGGYATEYEVLVSPDREDWNRLARVTDGEGGTIEFDASGASARYVWIRAIKPDGPDQVGSQMSIAEVEVYGLT